MAVSSVRSWGQKTRAEEHPPSIDFFLYRLATAKRIMSEYQSPWWTDWGQTGSTWPGCAEMQGSAVWV